MEIPVEIDQLEVYMPGDIITEEPGLMSGQNTYEDNGVIRSCVIGTVQKTNKLIVIVPLRSAYNPQIGDIVVGRVKEIQEKRWRIDINSSSEATLHLNSTFIPQQRQKTEEDELTMRNLFAENDLICAEVHSINNDKTINLHTRNVKYGKLNNGLLVNVSHTLIRKQKHHFIRLKCGIDLIFSHNGELWINNQDRTVREQKQLIQSQPYTIAQRVNIAKIQNILKLLNKEYVDISVDLIEDLFEITNKFKISPTDLMQQDKIEAILEHIQTKREEKKQQQLKKLQKNINILQEL